jgi:putative ABC transport system permease protein
MTVFEDMRAIRMRSWLDTLAQDARYALRAIRCNPAFSALVIITLALGIGANTAIFSVVHAMLLKPLPYRDADQLAFIWSGYSRGPMSGPDFRDIRENSRTLAELGGIWATGTVALAGDGDPEQLRSAFVTTNFFRVLGAESALGRTFREPDGVAGAPPTILLGWELFVRRYGGDPSIIGRQILVNDSPTTVIGVMPWTFRLLLPQDSAVPDHLQVWQPLWPEFERGPRGNQFLRVIGRMRAGVTIDQARSEVDSIASRLNQNGVTRVLMTVPLQADGLRQIREPLLALFAGVGVLLMIACVNVGSLLIARAASRSKEVALQLALGASRGRVLRQSATEALVLTLLGAAAGMFVGYAGLRLLLALAPESLSRMAASRFDVTVFAYALAITLLWSVLLSLAPMVEIFKANVGPANALAGAHGRAATTRVRYRMRAMLAVIQIGLSIVLLVGAGLLARAFIEVQRIDLGFRTAQYLTFRIALPDSRYRNSEAMVNAARELQSRLSGLPGVTGVGAISHLPYDDLPNWGLTYALDQEDAAGGATPRATTRAISTGLFETLGVQLLEGRFFTDAESAGQPVVIVDDILAQRLWPERSAVGRQIRLGQATPSGRAVVVGVVRHLRLRTVVEDLAPQIFVPYRLWQRSPMAYVVRTSSNPSALAADIRGAVASFDRQLPIYDVRPMDNYIEAAMSIRQFTMLIATLFAASALVLTCVGVYGLLAYIVAARRHEFGLRRALGADTGRVMRDVFREALGFALVGSLTGLAIAAFVAQLLRAQLYAVDPWDPIAYGLSAGLILLGVIVACWIPGRRATAISPMDALRVE